jgi:hypothetical protein
LSEPISEPVSDLGSLVDQCQAAPWVNERWHLVVGIPAFLAIPVIVLILYINGSFTVSPLWFTPFCICLGLLATPSGTCAAILVTSLRTRPRGFRVYEGGIAIATRRAMQAYPWEDLRGIAVSAKRCRFWFKDGAKFEFTDYDFTQRQLEQLGARLTNAFRTVPQAQHDEWDPRSPREGSHGAGSAELAKPNGRRFMHVANELVLRLGLSYRATIVAASEGLYLVFSDKQWQSAERGKLSDELPQARQFKNMELSEEIVQDPSWPVHHDTGTVLFVPREVIASATCSIWSGLRIQVGAVKYSCQVSFLRAKEVRRFLQEAGWPI